MRVSITGGTGFVGAHTVRAALEAGHRVRLLVRDEATVAPALTPLDVGTGDVELVRGDVLDHDAVDGLVRGADAVVHAAAVYSFDARRRRAVRTTNVAATEIVLDAALRAGVGRVVHVSTFGALLPARGVLGPRSPVGRPRETYLASKAAAEVVARRYQQAGAPVVVTYPPALLGPHDPKFGDQITRVRDTLRGLMPVWPAGRLPVGDVRDTAAMHAALLTRTDVAAARYFGPGHWLTTRQFVGALREVTGRALPTVHLPARAMSPVGRLADLVQRVWPWHIPAEYGAIYTCASTAGVTGTEGGSLIEARPVVETFADTVRWLYDCGRLSARAAGAAGHAHVVAS